jgi:hypothetical protein
MTIISSTRFARLARPFSGMRSSWRRALAVCSVIMLDGFAIWAVLVAARQLSGAP